jgi:hypothetical protein
MNPDPVKCEAANMSSSDLDYVAMEDPNEEKKPTEDQYIAMDVANNDMFPRGSAVFFMQERLSGRMTENEYDYLMMESPLNTAASATAKYPVSNFPRDTFIKMVMKEMKASPDQADVYID